jgi:hypothetical protein
MTFIVGRDGDVYQKDLGPETARVATGGLGHFCLFPQRTKSSPLHTLDSEARELTHVNSNKGAVCHWKKRSGDSSNPTVVERSLLGNPV